MPFMIWIIEELENVEGWFYEAYQEVKGWIYPFYLLKYPLYGLYGAFMWLVEAFYEFYQWLLWLENELGNIITSFNVFELLKTWLDWAADAWYWVRYAVSNVTDIIDDWWTSILPYLVTMINDVKSWTTTQFLGVIEQFFAVMSNYGDWIETQLNIFETTFLTLLADLRLWATTQVNDVVTTFLALIADITLWTTTEINNIKELLTTIVDLEIFTTWIEGWWGDRLLDIQSLIDTALLNFAGTLEGWQEIRGQVVEFFSDPLQWLYNRLDEFFERFW